MTDLDLFFDFSSNVAMATNHSKKSSFITDQFTFVALPFRNGLQYRNSDFKRLDRMNFSTLFAILVTFGREISEFMLLTIAPFASVRQKSAYRAKYLRMSWTYLDLLYRFSRRIRGDDYPNIHFGVHPRDVAMAIG